MAKTSIPFSNWHTMIQGLEYSPKDFFAMLEVEIKNKDLKDIKISRVKMSEGGAFSAKREYLRVTRKNLAFDICGAPYGNGFFVSWWLGDLPSGLKAFLYRIPVVSWLVAVVENVAAPETYYTNDTRMMFQSLIHSAVTKSVDQITNNKGLKELTAEEKKPVMRDFFVR